ncbi:MULTISPECIES: sensor histidine kinase [unclassified Lentimonas]|uniref:sensor histidine kinase n=1 Tax=unclassified Lentimonas TaxID=2630993 RepID=UPI0013280668|nr:MULTISPECIES: histidine kinase [unclassified Lentimonas]CAA6691737.1 Unannotated [Lentimonas sp. CC19]CAA6696097.1 Unannotated [Lentimonas sp. CC10]CAA7070088.1 Unannotated [Lentimonas sp. CC11]
MRYPEFTILYLLIAGMLSAASGFAKAEDSHEAFSLSQLEQRLAAIDARLEDVAHLSLRSGSGSIGYRSLSVPSSDRHEWIDIQLGEPRVIDEVILAPTLSRNAHSDFHADAFPKELRIWAGTDDDRQGRLVGSFHADAGALPRIAPLAMKIEPITASWIQVEATQLTRRDFDGNFCLQLSEVMVFSGDENVALHRPISSSSNQKSNSDAWGKEYLTDGHTPFLMDAAIGRQSIAYQGSHTKAPALIIDLEHTYPLSQVNFHIMETSDTVPTNLAGDYGMPHQIKIEGSNRNDFSEAVLLLETEQRSLNESGPIWMWRFPEMSYRYLRISTPPDASEDTLSNSSLNPLAQLEKPSASISLDAPDSSNIGFAEIELLSKGANVAINKPFKALNIHTSPGRDLAALTDGHNFYGAILSVREWMSQLAERHDLEFERTEVTSEITRRYTKQRQTLKWLIYLATVLTVSIFIIVYIERMRHRRQLAAVRQRFAADIHDEIGANLHTINLTSQLISKRSEQLPKEVNQLTQRIQTVIKRTSKAIRYVSDIQSSSELYVHLPDDLKRTAERILVGLAHEIQLDGEQFLVQINPRRHSDLVLFYQECLINICRHAGATKVTTFLSASPKQIQLTIIDNGKGLSQDTHHQPPPSLQRRAKLLRATIQVESPHEGGTAVIIKLRRRNRLMRASFPK